jgi:hypothetical protein
MTPKTIVTGDAGNHFGNFLPVALNGSVNQLTRVILNVAPFKPGERMFEIKGEQLVRVSAPSAAALSTLVCRQRRGRTGLSPPRDDISPGYGALKLDAHHIW